MNNIKLLPIVVEHVNTYLSNEFLIDASSTNPITINNSYSYLSVIVARTGEELFFGTKLTSPVNAKIKYISNVGDEIRTATYKIPMESNGSIKNISISVVTKRLLRVPEFSINSIINCTAAMSGSSVKVSIFQSSDNSYTFKLANSMGCSFSVGSIEYEVTNETAKGADLLLLKSAVAISVVDDSGEASFNISINNPNYGASNLTPFGFLNETNYSLYFSKEFTVEGKSYSIPFFIYISFMPSVQVVMSSYTIQDVNINRLNTKIISTYSFKCNVAATEKNFKIGIVGRKTYNIPTSLQYEVRDGLSVPGISGSTPMSLSIIVMSIVKTFEYYTMKFVTQATIPNNRKLIASTVNIPMQLQLSDTTLNFNIPVKLNG